MRPDDLSQTLLGLSAWFGSVAEGHREFTPEGMEAFDQALDRAALQAIALEYQLAAALDRPVKTPALLAAIRSGKVSVLPTVRALAATYSDALPSSDGWGDAPPAASDPHAAPAANPE